MPERTFEQWLAEFVALATAAGCPDYVKQTGDECWREQYDDGVEPDEAWSTELSYAAEDADPDALVA